MQHGRFCPAETLIYVNKLVFCSKTLKRFDLSKVNVSFLILSSPSSPSTPSKKSLRASSLSKNSLKAGSRHVLFVQSVPFWDKKRLPEGSPNSLKHASYNSRICSSERPVFRTIISIGTPSFSKPFAISSALSIAPS